MTTELIFILVTGGLAALVAAGALVAVLRGWGEQPYPAPETLPIAGPEPSEAGVLPMAPSHDAVVRVVWWVAIAGVLVGIGISNAYAANRSAIYALGGIAVVTVVVLYEMLPRRWRGRWSLPASR